MIIDTSTIWNTITNVILPIISIIAFIYLFYTNLKIRPLMKFAQKIMKQWGTMMVNEREEKKHVQQLTEDQKSSRKKLATAIKEKAPFKLLDNHTDDEIIALLADEDLIKGAMFLGGKANDVVQSVLKVLSPKQKKEAEAKIRNIPTIQ